MAVIEYIEFHTAPLPLGPETQALADAQTREPDPKEAG